MSHGEGGLVLAMHSSHFSTFVVDDRRAVPRFHYQVLLSSEPVWTQLQNTGDLIATWVLLPAHHVDIFIQWLLLWTVQDAVICVSFARSRICLLYITITANSLQLAPATIPDTVRREFICQHSSGTLNRGWSQDTIHVIIPTMQWSFSGLNQIVYYRCSDHHNNKRDGITQDVKERSAGGGLDGLW